MVTVSTTCFNIKQDTKHKNNVTLRHIGIFAFWTLLWCTVKLQISTRHREQSNNKYKKRQLIEYMLKNYTLHNINKIIFYSTYYNWHLNTKSIGQYSKEKKTILITHYPPCDKEHTCSSSYTCQTPWLANMRVNRHWWIIMWH